MGVLQGAASAIEMSTSVQDPAGKKDPTSTRALQSVAPRDTPDGPPEGVINPLGGSDSMSAAPAAEGEMERHRAPTEHNATKSNGVHMAVPM